MSSLTAHFLRTASETFSPPETMYFRGEERNEEDQVVEYLKNLRRVFDKIHFFPVPTVAAIDGAALGGGLELAIACDFTHSDSALSLQVGLGIIPGAGGTQRAPRLIGLTRAKEMIYTCRLLNAQEAHSWGLIDYLAEEGQTAIDRATSLAESMSSSAPLALSAAKQSISRGFELELAQGLALETECYETLLPTLDRREALKAFAEKRKAEFRGM
ncbi:hypothetical protein L7F22_015975 [Adiantum nelumboides]|nr:hypothetical protein [Adiantum nelumboides]